MNILKRAFFILALLGAFIVAVQAFASDNTIAAEVDRLLNEYQNCPCVVLTVDPPIYQCDHDCKTLTLYDMVENEPESIDDFFVDETEWLAFKQTEDKGDKIREYEDFDKVKRLARYEAQLASWEASLIHAQERVNHFTALIAKHK